MPEGVELSLDSDATFDPEDYSYPHGTHLCATEVDTETGHVKIRSYVCVDDIGEVVNPLIVEGQVHGGLAQGIAQALYEEAIHDEQGTLTTATFVDYLVPGAPDLPTFTTDRTTSPATTNDLGVKGVGEAGTIASTPAVVNSVLDALRPYGVKDIDMPMSPQRVWKALQGAATVTGEGEAASASPHWQEPVQSGGVETDGSDVRSDAGDAGSGAAGSGAAGAGGSDSEPRVVEGRPPGVPDDSGSGNLPDGGDADGSAARAEGSPS
jgi:hypothetical protein